MKTNSRKKTGEQPRRRRKNVNTADWAAADPKAIQRVITAIGVLGGAARFGYSRDGGAYSLGLYGDGKPFTEYLQPTEDVNEWLEGIAHDYE